HALLFHFGNVHQTVLAGHDLHKDAEVHDAHHRHVFVNLADLWLGRQQLDVLLGTIDTHHVRAGDEDCAIVLDIDFSPRLSNDLVDGFAPLTNHFTDLVRINLDRLNTRCIRTHFLTWTIKNTQHVIQNMCPSLLSLGECQAQDVRTETVDLHVHLQC